MKPFLTIIGAMTLILAAVPFFDHMTTLDYFKGVHSVSYMEDNIRWINNGCYGYEVYAHVDIYDKIAWIGQYYDTAIFVCNKSERDSVEDQLKIIMAQKEKECAEYCKNLTK